MSREALVLDQLKESFQYDPQSPSGLVWKISRGKSKVGKVAGNIKGNGYYQVGLRGKYYPCHRVVWILSGKELPAGFVIDHIDNNTTNNLIENLRLSTIQGNTHNRVKTPNKTSRFKGVCWSKASNKWKAGITFNHKQKHIGYFDSEEEAKLAYELESARLFGEFAWRQHGEV